MKAFDQLKEHNGQKYKGMRVGASHNWDYDDGHWQEQKLAPDLWDFRFDCIKGRHVDAPVGSGAPDGTEYFWYIVADQKVKKVDANHYQTVMEGLKLKVAHKRPYWKKFSCEYPDQQTEQERKIAFLSDLISKLNNGGIIHEQGSPGLAQPTC